jgi:hypothetical protein
MATTSASTEQLMGDSCSSASRKALPSSLDSAGGRADLLPSAVRERERTTVKRIWKTGAVVALLMFSTACVSRRVEPMTPNEALPGNTEVATSLVIEQFLRAANENDLDTMASLFGTVNGTNIGRVPKDQLDQQLFAIASILRHESYEIVRRQIVPGRRSEATEVTVRMNMGRNRIIDVPYVLVYTNANNWLIEQIDLEKITTAR